MQPTHIFANLPVPDIDEARDFYADYLGLGDEQIRMDWVTRFCSPDGQAVVQLVTRDATAAYDAAISVTVGDGVEEAYAEAQRRGYEIVHPLTTEPWASDGSSSARPMATLRRVRRFWSVPGRPPPPRARPARPHRPAWPSTVTAGCTAHAPRRRVA